MWVLLLLAIFAFFLIPKDTEEDIRDENDFIDEMMILSYDEEDEFVEEMLLLLDEEEEDDY